MNIRVEGLGAKSLQLTTVDAEISKLDNQIQKITSSIFYRFFGLGSSALRTHIGELKTIAYTHLPTLPAQKNLADKIQKAINPILKNSSSSTLALAKDLEASLQPVTEGFSLAKISDESFAINYNKDPDYSVQLHIKGKTLDLKGAGLNEDGTIKAIGAFGRVLFGIDPETGKEIAVKIVKRQPHQTMDVLKKEAEFLLKMQGSEHVLGASEIAFQGDFMFVVMDKLDGDELFDRLHPPKDTPSLTLREKASIAIDILKGLKEMHSKGIIHRDLKPQNIFIDKQGKATLIDLGLAREIKEKTTRYSGTEMYMAPELFLEKEQTEATDIYSTGLVLIEIFTNKNIPVPTKKTEARVSKNITLSNSEVLKGLDKPLVDAIEGCLKFNPKDRTPIDTLIKNLEAYLKNNP